MAKEKFAARYGVLAAACAMACVTVACSQNPDQVRERTAEATSAVSRDAKAMAEGVKEGLSRDKTFNLNKASKSDLMSLPGISDREADHIIAERPYESTKQLVSRHILSAAEYDKIKDRIMASQ